MQIDWFTVGAQIVNFLLLVYLLKRFLYGPIVNAMDRRERRVTDRLRDARESEEAAERRAEAYRHKAEELDERRAALLDEARKEAEKRRKQLVEEARAEVEDARRRWRTEVEREKESFLRELRGQISAWVTGAVRRALRELADTELEERVVGGFRERLRKLDDDERERLVRALRESEEPLRVATAFELSQEQRDALRDALRDATGERVDLRFAESADVVCGIELRTPGAAVAWSLDAFVGDVEEKVADALRSAESEGAEPVEAEAAEPGEEHADAEGSEEEDRAR